MLSKLEIIGFILLFITIYFILYIDTKFRNDKKVSLKTSIILSFIFFIIYKILKPYIFLYLCTINNIKQDIITEMADF
jgi:hypothetical protein